MRKERRGPWYMVTGFILGTTLGVLYAWLVSPVAYIDTPPASLRADFKDQYRTLIALAYASNGDLGRARARLSLLGEPNSGSLLAEQVQQAVAQGRPVSEIQAMRLLAEALGIEIQLSESTPIPTPSGTPTPTPTATAPTPASRQETPEDETVAATLDPKDNPTSTPAEQHTPFPTNTPGVLATAQPTFTPVVPFLLRERQFVCEPTLTHPLIQVEVFDSAGQPVPGMGIHINWEGGQERFFTGMKPEVNLGYADFEMAPGVVYALRLADGGQLVSDLRTRECTAPGSGQYWGSWRLRFAQP